MTIQDAVKQLVNAGLSEGRIAREVGGTTQPTIHRIKCGETKNPGYDVGRKIMQLHAKYCAKKKSK